jgi:hypothetical protein
VGKIIQEQRKNKGTIEGELNSKARRIEGKTRGSDE